MCASSRERLCIMSHPEWMIRLNGSFVRVKRWSDMVKDEVFQESGHLAATGIMDALSHSENEAVAEALYAALIHSIHRTRLDDHAWRALRRAFEDFHFIIVPLHVDPKKYGWEAVPIDGRRAYVMRLLQTRYGYTANAAAGIVGNLEVESGILPNRLEQSSDISPLRAPGFDGHLHDFTPGEIEHPSKATGTGPSFPGVGLAQWTWPPRRRGLFLRKVGGVPLGVAVLQDMDAQVEYLVSELRTGGNRLQARLMAAGSVDDACDLVAYEVEGPKAMQDHQGHKLPMTDPRVQKVFQERRPLARAALRATQTPQ